jgi:hypothetical protein
MYTSVFEAADLGQVCGLESQLFRSKTSLAGLVQGPARAYADS